MTDELNTPITIVSGLPRSGTSLMMQMLQAGGHPVLTDGLRAADENNRRGYLEYEPVKRLRQERSWLPQARGQAVKIIHLLLRELPMDQGLHYRIVFMHRPLPEVLASQAAMLGRDGKAAASAAVLQRAFEAQLAQLAQWLPAQPGVQLLPVHYHQVLREPLAQAQAVQQFLQQPLDVAAMAAAVDPALHRERSTQPAAPAGAARSTPA